MPLLDLQRRGQQIGRIRIGQQVPTGKTDRDGREKTRPAKLSTFRFTTQSRNSADAIAEQFGGTVREWRGEWEVITTQSAIGVTVPPRDQVVSQWYEMWTAGGCQRRCDSVTEQVSGQPCLCPHAADPADVDEVARKAIERSELAAQNPPAACKRVTRISVMIPDLPGLGVFRLDTGSYYAASEIGDAAAIMQMARDQGVFLPAVLRIEQRSRVAGGQTKKYPVPVLEITATFRQIASGELGAAGMAAQLPPAPDAPKAIEAGPGRAAAPAIPPSRPAPAAPAPAPAAAGADMSPQQIADAAQLAASTVELLPLIDRMEASGLQQSLVCTDYDRDVYEDLHPFMVSRYAELKRAS